MFKAKTVFILGAGASWHYGYPTGEELVKLVIEKARIASDYLGTYLANPSSPLAHRPIYVERKATGDGIADLQKQWMAVANECQDLIERLTRVDPLVIDYFIFQNQHLAELAKMLIAWVILEREFVHLRYSGNENRRKILPEPYPQDNWHRFIIQRMTSSCENAKSLLNNSVNFITFNYDVSLEIELRRGLGNLSLFSEITDEFLSGDRVLHVYGSIRKEPAWEIADVDWGAFGAVSRAQDVAVDAAPPELWNKAKHIFDYAYNASQGIETVAPNKSIKHGNVDRIQNVIHEAECVYILEYGFDPNNNRLLGLSKTFNGSSQSRKSVMFTNFGNHGRINKIIAQMMFGTVSNRLMEENGQMFDSGRHYYEKSVKNVYDALAYDFDAPEERSHS